MTDLIKLRELAEKATRGPWVYECGPSLNGEYHLINTADNDAMIAECWDESDATDKSNAQYIAAANPTIIITLIDALEAANKRIAELENKIAIDEAVFT